MKINVFVLIMALLLLFSSCEGLFEIKGRWNRNDPNYDPTNDPVNQPNLPPIAPSNLKITFFVDEANEDKPCVRLNWQNNSTFTQKTIVERAPEGSSDFSKIGEVKYIVSPDGQDTASEQFVDDGLSTTQLSETGFVYRITAVNPSGSSEVVDKLFYCPPVISFAAYAEATWINEKTADNVNITFYFKNQSYGMIDTYSWNFGDNTEIIAEENPSHIFRTKNIYSITLTCDGKGGKNSYTRDDYVAIGMPQANFSLYTDSGFGAESLIDENNMLVDDGDTIYIQESSVFHDAKLNNWFLIKEPWGRVIEPTSISVQSGSNYRRYSIQLPEFGNGDEDLPAIGQYDFFLQVMDFATHRSQKHQFLNIGKAKLDFKFLYTPEDISITKNAGVMINFENNSEGCEPLIFTCHFGDETLKENNRFFNHTYNTPGIYQCYLSVETGFNEIINGHKQEPKEGVLEIKINGGTQRVSALTNLTSPRDIKTCDIDQDGNTDFYFLTGTGSSTQLRWLENEDDNRLYLRDFVNYSLSDIIKASMIERANNEPLLIISRGNTSDDCSIEIYSVNYISSENRGLTQLRTLSSLGANISYAFQMNGVNELVIMVHGRKKHDNDNNYYDVTQLAINLTSADNSSDSISTIIDSAPATPSEIVFGDLNSAASGYEIIILSKAMLASQATVHNVFYYEYNNADNIKKYEGDALVNLQNAETMKLKAIDGNTVNDLVVYNGESISWYEHQPNSTALNNRFIARTNSTILSPSVFNTFFVGDIDQASHADIVYGQTDKIGWAKNNGNGDDSCSFTEGAVIDTLSNGNFRSIAAAYIDDDDQLDIIAAVNNTIYWYSDEMINMPLNE